MFGAAGAPGAAAAATAGWGGVACLACRRFYCGRMGQGRLLQPACVQGVRYGVAMSQVACRGYAEKQGAHRRLPGASRFGELVPHVV